MNILPKIRTRFGENIGVEVFITPPLLKDNNETFISTDAVSGAASFAVDNGLKFSTSQYILVGAMGAQKSEILKIHASTTPTASLITLTGADSFAHNRGEKIAFIPYNQIVIERSTDGGVNYSALATVDIRADSTETYYQHTTGAATDYYRVKFSNSTSSGVSQYSDGIIGTGYADASAGRVIRSALISSGEKIDSVITKEFLYEALNDGRSEVDQMPGVEKFSFRTSFDYVAGAVIAGQNTLALPSDMRESSTNKNLLSVRIGRSQFPLSYVDKNALNRWYRGVSRSTLNGAITSASTSIIMTKSGDVEEAGSVTIAGESVSDVLDPVDYTANSEATNTLSGVTGIQATGHSSGAIVWQGVSFGYPLEYTVDAGQIIFSQPFDDDHAGENIYIDYYKKLSDINSDADALDEPNYKMFIPYLKYRMKKRRNADLDRDNDSDYKEWKEKRDAAVVKEYTGQNVRFEVDIP